MTNPSVTSTNYGVSIFFDGDFEEAESQIRNSLLKEGFGVLTEIDVKATLKKKLNIDYPKYKILGACNPPFAYQALKAEPEIGLLLPCNVIVHEDKVGNVKVSALLPTAALSQIDNEKVGEIAGEVEEKMINVLENLQKR